MNKKIMFIVTLMTHIGLISAQENNNPTIVENFNTTIMFNESANTLGEHINSRNPEFNEVPLLLVETDESTKNLGKIGKPKCNPNNISKLTELLRNEKYQSIWCQTPDMIVITDKKTDNLKKICTIAANFIKIQKEAEEKNTAIVSLFKVSS